MTRFEKDELYAAGDFPNQSLGGDGLPQYIADNDSTPFMFFDSNPKLDIPDVD